MLVPQLKIFALLPFEEIEYLLHRRSNPFQVFRFDYKTLFGQLRRTWFFSFEPKGWWFCIDRIWGIIFEHCSQKATISGEAYFFFN